MHEENAALRQKFDSLKGAEQHKNALIEDLLDRLDSVTNEYHQEKLDHARESHFNRDVQLREIHLQNELRKYQALMERDAFVLVLVDGDGMIFNEELVAKGEAGGKEAAALLWNAVTADIRYRIPDLGADYKIVTRVYANLKGLGDVCSRAGMISHPSLLGDFARGFTGAKQLFDFVDVGTGKDRADDKISEIFKLHLYDCHCRQIYFGCSHDNGYARLLEDVLETAIMNSITLLEGVPFEKELEQLKSQYAATRFDGLFRTEKINLYNVPPREPQRPPVTAPPQTNGLQSPSQYQSPYQPTLPPPEPQPQQRTPSSSSTSSAPLNAAAPTWASAAMKPPIASPPLTPQPAKAITPQVPRNKYGQRVDPVGTYDANEVKRIKKLKMCNVHFLRGDCPYNPCTHDHYYQPTKNEVATLRYVSRMTPCKFGLECDDLKCIYGHRCPVDREGSKDCRFGENCRFELESHGIDRRVVNVVKVGGK